MEIIKKRLFASPSLPLSTKSYALSSISLLLICILSTAGTN